MRIQRHMYIQVQVNTDLQTILLLIHSLCTLLSGFSGDVFGLTFWDHICWTTLVLAASEDAAGVNIFDGVVVGFGTVQVFGTVREI